MHGHPRHHGHLLDDYCHPSSSLLVLLYQVWLVVNGPLSPSVLIFDVFIGEILNFLDIIKVS